MLVPAGFFYSCDTYNFSHPQPVNKENSYEFPAAFRNNWIDDDSEQVLIKKNTIGIVMSEKLSIVKGLWPKQDANGKYKYLSPAYKSFSSILFDSLENPMDTISNYLLNGDHIYEFADKGLLEQGYHYKTAADTIFILKTDTFTVDLGSNAFLRDIGNGFFVMNIRNQVLGKESRWWQLFVLEMKNKDLINIWYCSSGLTKSTAMFYENHNNYYFNSAWTSADMNKLIKEGAFEMCNQLHRN
jgi:hypothetical protein